MGSTGRPSLRWQRWPLTGKAFARGCGCAAPCDAEEQRGDGDFRGQSRQRCGTRGTLREGVTSRSAHTRARDPGGSWAGNTDAGSPRPRRSGSGEKRRSLLWVPVAPPGPASLPAAHFPSQLSCFSGPLGDSILLLKPLQRLQPPNPHLTEKRQSPKDGFQGPRGLKPVFSALASYSSLWAWPRPPSCSQTHPQGACSGLGVFARHFGCPVRVWFGVATPRSWALLGGWGGCAPTWASQKGVFLSSP